MLGAMAVTVVAAAVLVGATLQSALGFGSALVVSPALLLVLEPSEALTVLIVLGLVTNLLILVGERRRWQVRGRLVLVLLLGALPGLGLGAVLLRVAGRPALQVAVGLLVLSTVGLQLARSTTRPRSGRTSLPATMVVGVLVGTLTTSTGTNGPPMVLWLDRAGLSPSELRDTLFVAFSALGVLGLATLLASGSSRLGPVGPFGLVGLTALVLLGRALGWVVFRRLSPTAFRGAGLALVAVLGVISLVAGLTR